MSIEEALNKISKAIYGSEVRQALIDAINSCYKDATINGNANMEVGKARGLFSSLVERLNDSDSKISKLNNSKANNTKVEDLQQQINNLVLDAGGDSNSEVVQARAVFKTLNDRISSCKVNIEEYCRRTLVMGSIDGINYTLNTSTSTLTNNTILTATDGIEFSIQDGYKYILFKWKTDNSISTDNFLSSSGWKTTTETIEKGTYFSVQIAKIDGNPCSLSDINAISLKEVNSEIEALKNKPTLYHVLGTGQSLSVGAEGSPAVTTLCPLEYVGKAFVFNGGARVIDGENFEIGEQGDLSDKSTMYLMAAHEQDHTVHIDDNKDGIPDRDSVVGETISSALAYQFVQYTHQKVLVSQHGFGGLAYQAIKKGTLSYNNMIRAVYNAKQIAERSNMGYEVVGLTLVHGEADSTIGTSESQYISYLEELQSDIDLDVRAITGQSRAVKLYVSQTASASSYKLSKSDIPNAIFKASIQNENIVMVCPQYWFTYKSVHMDNKGYRRLGEYYGGVIARDFNKLPEVQLYPIKSVLNGNKVDITFNIPSPSTLGFDVDNVLPRSDGNYGFELNGDSNNAKITSVDITARDIVTITFDKIPSNNSYIGYAFTPLPDEMGQIGMNKGIRGNLRSNYAFTKILDGAELPQWCCIFNIPINYNN